MLTSAQIEQFERDGFLIVEDVLSDKDLAPIHAEYEQLLGQVAEKMFAEGKLTSTYANLPFDERYTAMLGDDTAVFDQLEITLPLENDNFPADATIHTGEAVFGLLTNPKLLDVVESIIGSEIYSNPVQHIRLKPSQNNVPDSIMGNSYVGVTTWHQDQGALMDDADETQVLTTWVAITDAPEEMGCLIAVPRSHRKNGGALTMHCPGKGITAENFIPEAILGDDEFGREIVSLPVKRGGVVLLDQYTEHAALANTSGKLRWSFDLRWNPVGQPTGRPAFPGFIARSRKQPDAVLRDPEIWSQLWEDARRQLVGGDYDGQVFNAARWEKYVNAPLCA